MKRWDNLIIQGWMYKLDGIESLKDLAVFAWIFSLTPEAGMKTKCSISDLMEITRLNQQSVEDIVCKLCGKGILQRDGSGFTFNVTVSDSVRNHLSCHG